MASEMQVLDGEGLADVGARVRAARAKRGITRKQLAAASGASERYLALIEAGAGNPSLAVLTALAAALDTAVAELLPLGGERSEAAMRAAAAVRNLSGDRLPGMLAWIDGANVQSNEKAQRVVLIGLRGAGKSSLGGHLADRLKLPFLELSKEVEKAYGGEIGLLIDLSGQSALRRYEAEAWEAVRAAHTAAIIAAPGGIVADGQLFGRVLATAHSVWLQASPEHHMERVMAQGDFRPMSSTRGAMADLKAILEARGADYARADATVDTSAGSYEETLAALERIVRPMVAP